MPTFGFEKVFTGLLYEKYDYSYKVIHTTIILKRSVFSFSYFYDMTIWGCVFILIFFFIQRKVFEDHLKVKGKPTIFQKVFCKPFFPIQIIFS